MKDDSNPTVLKSSEEDHAQGEAGGSDPTRTRAQTKYLNVANFILTLAVVVLLVFLFLSKRERTRLQRENSELEKTNRQLELSASELLSGPPVAQPGDVVPAFQTTNLEGNRIAVNYDGSSRYLLFIFSPVCSVCADEVPKWNRLAQLAREGNISCFGVSLDAADLTRANLANSKPNFDVLIMPSLAIRRAYRVVAEPVVFLVSEQGAVDWVHYGRLSDQKIAELSSLMQARG